MKEKGLRGSVYTFSALITGCGHLGRPDLAKDLFDEMIENEVKPNTGAGV